MTYRISEIFRSIQGEGPAVGRDSIFVRFAGCNLSCEFCDEGLKDRVVDLLDSDDIVDAALDLAEGDRNLPLILTGGEPLLQLDDHLLDVFARHFSQIHLETNGARATAEKLLLVSSARLGELAEVVVSPKDVPPSVELLQYATAIKVLVDEQGKVIGAAWLENIVRRAGSQRVGTPLRIIQPITYRGHKFIEKQSWHAVNLAKKFSIDFGVPWRVIPQTHVWMGLR